MFADIRGFTAAMDRLEGDPLLVPELLDRWHTTVGDMALKHSQSGGDCILDKFVGDGAMLLFGALTADGSDIQRVRCCAEACRFALDLKNAFDGVVGVWRKKCEKKALHEIPPMSLGIGICFGAALVGTFSVGAETDRRIHYTALGSPVNTAARLEGIAGKTKRNKSGKAEITRPSILVHKAVAANLDGVYDFSEGHQEELQGLGLVRYYGLKGKINSIQSLEGSASHQDQRPR